MKKMWLFALLVAGCGGASTPTPAPSPQPVPNAVVTGQYDLVLTSTNGHGTANLYTDFTQTGKTFTGAATTLVCPSNDVSQCKGNDPPVTSITPTGTVSGAKVTILVSYPNNSGADTVSMVGNAAATSLSGSYTDLQGDIGTWIALPGASLAGSYNGTFNSTATPQSIAPTVLITLAQDNSFNLTGTAMIMSFPCISSLTLSGQAIGQAFALTDAVNKAHIIAVPTPTGSNYTFIYSFDPTSPHCAGDSGTGVLTSSPNPWDY